MKPLSRIKSRGRAEYSKSYAGIDRRVMLSDSFGAIGPNSSRVLLWLAFQYNGKNNGYLSATRAQALSWGIGGTDTLGKAMRELVENRLILLTRQGRFSNPGGTPNLYALTWEPIHSRAGDPLDVQPTAVAPRTDWARSKTNHPVQFLECVDPVSGHGAAQNG